jgi:hypothetical protein
MKITHWVNTYRKSADRVYFSSSFFGGIVYALQKDDGFTLVTEYSDENMALVREMIMARLVVCGIRKKWSEIRFDDLVCAALLPAGRPTTSRRKRGRGRHAEAAR